MLAGLYLRKNVLLRKRGLKMNAACCVGLHSYALACINFLAISNCVICEPLFGNLCRGKYLCVNLQQTSLILGVFLVSVDTP